MRCFFTGKAVSPALALNRNSMHFTTACPLACCHFLFLFFLLFFRASALVVIDERSCGTYIGHDPLPRNRNPISIFDLRCGAFSVGTDPDGSHPTSLTSPISRLFVPLVAPHPVENIFHSSLVSVLSCTRCVTLPNLLTCDTSSDIRGT